MLLFTLTGAQINSILEMAHGNVKATVHLRKSRSLMVTTTSAGCLQSGRFTSLEDTDVAGVHSEISHLLKPCNRCVEVRRFVKFLDLLYDRRRRLVISCEASVEELFQEIRNEERG